MASVRATHLQIMDKRTSPKMESLKRKNCPIDDIDIAGGLSTAVIETKTEANLNERQERVKELKAEIRKGQEEYAKIYNEMKALQSGFLSDDQILKLWQDLERKEEAQRIEEMKQENLMREREQQKQEMQRCWRITGQTVANLKSSTDTTPVDMDVEEIIGTVKPKSESSVSSGNPVIIQTSTSPLLSSLLKTPTPGNSISTTAVTTQSGTSVAHVTAPTITTLLTSGSHHIRHQPAIIMKSIIPPNEAAQLLAQPVSGPPIDNSNSNINLVSPSQSAPTLSMLLEKNKNLTVTSIIRESIPSEIDKKTTESVPEAKSQIPITINKNEGTTKNTGESGGEVLGPTNTNDSDETDQNEEQQLMEVFKNIGNIDELDIDVSAVIDDEEVDFLKEMDQETPNETPETMDFEKLDAHQESSTQQQKANLPSKEIKNETKNEEKPVDVHDDKSKTDEKIKNNEKDETEKSTPSSESSDDSNDNIPLSAVASLESKERNQNTDSNQEKNFLKEKGESALKNEDEIKETSDDGANVIETIKIEKDSKLNKVAKETKENAEKSEEPAILSESDDTKDSSSPNKTVPKSENLDISVIATENDESNSNQQLEEAKPNDASSETQNNPDKELKVEIKSDESETQETKNMEDIDNDDSSISGIQGSQTQHSDKITTPLPPTISIADTDEDSSTTDASVSTRKDDKIHPLNKQTTQQRKNIQDTPRNEQKTDDDTTGGSSAVSSTPVKPPMLRKLRDRDRSESPMIDDETTSDHSVNQRLRRRYSSTPILDSIPNSPASSEREDRETRASKKSLLSIYNTLQHNKNVIAFQRVLNEDHIPIYDTACLRPMDLQIIKKNIESGAIRSVSELQRDIMLMCQNVLMLFKENSSMYKAAHIFMRECQVIHRDFVTNPFSVNDIPTMKIEKESKDNKSNSNAVKVRSGSRKSLRIS